MKNAKTGWVIVRKVYGRKVYLTEPGYHNESVAYSNKLDAVVFPSKHLAMQTLASMIARCIMRGYPNILQRLLESKLERC